MCCSLACSCWSGATLCSATVLFLVSFLGSGIGGIFCYGGGVCFLVVLCVMAAGGILQLSE
jgi:hypothetical protein